MSVEKVMDVEKVIQYVMDRLSEKVLNGYKRGSDHEEWLSGMEPWTNGEKELTKGLRGPNKSQYASEIIGIHRRNLQEDILNGKVEGPLTKEEAKLLSKFGGDNAQMYREMALSLHRRNKFQEWLNGE